MAVITGVRRRRLRCRLEVAAALPQRPSYARSWSLHRSAASGPMLEERYSRRAVAPAGALAEQRELRLVSRIGFDDDYAVLAEDGWKILGKPVLQGRKHLVGRIDQHEIVAATRRGLGGESAQGGPRDYPRARD